MENLENEELFQDSEYIESQPEMPESAPEPEAPVVEIPPVQSAPYSGAGVGRKESPFADSPYVMNHQPQQEQPRTYQPPQSGYVPPVPPQQIPRKPKIRKYAPKLGLKRALSAVLTLALIIGSCAVTAALVNEKWEERTYNMTERFNARLDEMQQQIDAASAKAESNKVYMDSTVVMNLSPGQVYAQNVDAVVLISCEVSSTVYGQVVKGQSTGSGFILSENGYVVTNHHVIEGATKITVTRYDGTVMSAVLVGSDAINDVAVLKVEGSNLPVVTVGSSTKLAVGDQVVAIGNPLGELTSTMTAGYVSAKERDVITDGVTISMIQTDVAINSGNSGGPLFNMNGEVIGITTAKYSGESSSGVTIEGIGFAIPIDDVIPIISDLVQYGYVTGSYLGVLASDMNLEAAAYYNMPVGAYVQEVTPGYCAEEAGLQAKDIIVAMGEYPVKNLSTLTRVLRKFKPGDTTTITVYRGGREIVLPITLDEKPAANQQIQIPAEGEMPKDGSFEEWYNYFAPFFGNGNNKD